MRSTGSAPAEQAANASGCSPQLKSGEESCWSGEEEEGAGARAGTYYAGNSVKETGDRMKEGAVKAERSPENEARDLRNCQKGSDSQQR